MKIALVVHQFLPRHRTGTELYGHHLARAFQALGHEPRVFCYEEGARPFLGVRDDEEQGVPVRRVFRREQVFAEPLSAEYRSPVVRKMFRDFLSEVRPDVVHVLHVMHLGADLLEETRAWGLPTFVHLTDYWFLCPRTQMLDFEGRLCAGPSDPWRCVRCAAEVSGNYRHLLEMARLLGKGRPEAVLTTGPRVGAEVASFERLNEVARNRWPWLRDRLLEADGLFAPSRYLMGRFEENGLPAGRITHLPYGLEPGRIRRPTGDRRAGPCRFGFIGNIAPFKGALLALDAFRSQADLPAEFHLFGAAFSEGRKGLEVLQEKVAGDARIRLRGPFDPEELPRVLAEIDVLIAPSLWHENAPFVVLEALAGGVPVIGSDVGGIAEVLRPGLDGHLFRRGDAEDLGRALARAVTSPLPAPPERAFPTTRDNATVLLGRYEQALRGRAPPVEPAEPVADGLYRELLFLAEHLEEIQATEGGAGVLRLPEVLRDLRRDLAGHRQEAEVLRREVERLRADCGALQAEAGVLQEEHRREVEGRTRMEEDLRRDLEGHRALAVELERRLRESEEVRRALEADLEGHRKVVTDLGSDLEGHRRLAVDLRNDLEGHRLHAANLRADLEGHRKALEEARQALAAREKDLEELRAQCGILELSRGSAKGGARKGPKGRRAVQEPNV